MVRITSALFPMDSTLCIIKPDAMRLGYKEAICHMIHIFGFNVIAEGRFKFTRVRAEQFYRAHSKMLYFETLIRFMIRLRAMYGTDGRMNAVHGSDTVKEAEVEIKFFFPTIILEPYPNSVEAANYFKAHVQPLLLKGLTAFAKQKPASETIGAVRWLANWLHENNPRLPLVCICVEKEDEKKKEKPIMEFPFY